MSLDYITIENLKEKNTLNIYLDPGLNLELRERFDTPNISTKIIPPGLPLNHNTEIVIVVDNRVMI